MRNTNTLQIRTNMKIVIEIRITKIDKSGD